MLRTGPPQGKGGARAGRRPARAGRPPSPAARVPVRFPCRARLPRLRRVTNPAEPLLRKPQDSTRNRAWPWARLRGGWWLYAAFWLAIGLALALAESQHPQRPPARRPWEPFVLEMSSTLAIGWLALGVYRLVDLAAARRWRWPQVLLMHAGGALAFFVAHVGLMHLLRLPFYATIDGRLYAPMSPLQLLLFEGPKDAVSYVVVVALSMLVQARQGEQRQREQVMQARAALAELRLARVSEQLHPHFLFNCLNSVSSLIEEDSAAAITMVARIGDLLRTVLALDGRSAVGLGQELQLVRQYLAIEQLRFGAGLRLQVDVDESLHGALVPPLVLQPLVENAVKHGFRAAASTAPQRDWRLRITGTVDGGELRLELANPLPAGPNPAAPAAAAQPAATAGRGLALVRERLALMHGDQARLDVAGSDGLFVARLRLPLQQPLPAARDEPAQGRAWA